MIVFFGDLHLGNLYSDVKGVLDLYNNVFSFVDEGEEIIVVFDGDIIEGANKYRTQIYKMFNVEPLHAQIEYTRWFIRRLLDIADEHGVKAHIHLVLGNHDIGYDYGNLLYILKDKNVHVTIDTLILNTDEYRIICKHQLNRYSRGSYLTWWSGYLLNLGEKILDQYNGNVLVTAHTHRPDIAIINRDNKFFIGLPAYIVSNEDYKYNKAVLIDNEWIHIEINNKNKRTDVLRYNINTLMEILGVEPEIDEYTYAGQKV